MFKAQWMILALLLSLPALAEEDKAPEAAEGESPEAVEHFGVGDAPIQRPDREPDEEVTQPVVSDNDGDGVPDKADLCPDTDEDAEVNRSGCPPTIGRQD